MIGRIRCLGMNPYMMAVGGRLGQQVTALDRTAASGYTALDVTGQWMVGEKWVKRDRASWLVPRCEREGKRDPAMSTVVIIQGWDATLKLVPGRSTPGANNAEACCDRYIKHCASSIHILDDFSN